MDKKYLKRYAWDTSEKDLHRFEILRLPKIMHFIIQTYTYNRVNKILSNFVAQAYKLTLYKTHYLKIKIQKKQVTEKFEDLKRITYT